MCIKRSLSLMNLKTIFLAKPILNAILKFSRRFSLTAIGMDVEDDDFNKKKNRFWVKFVWEKIVCDILWIFSFLFLINLNHWFNIMSFMLSSTGEELNWSFTLESTLYVARNGFVNIIMNIYMLAIGGWRKTRVIWTLNFLFIFYSKEGQSLEEKSRRDYLRVQNLKIHITSTATKWLTKEWQELK